MRYLLKPIFLSAIFSILALVLPLPALAQPSLAQCSRSGDACQLTRADGTVVDGVCDLELDCIEFSASGSGTRAGGGSCAAQCEDTDRGLCVPNPLTDCDIVAFLNRVIDWIIYLSIFVTVIMIIVAGIIYVTAGGNTERVQRANRTLIYALVGFAILLMSKALALIIASALGANVGPDTFK